MNQNIHIILDSVSSILELDFVHEPRVHVMRLVNILGDMEWLDGDKSPEELVSLIDKYGILPQTSQPPMGVIEELFTDLAKQGKKAIYIAIDSGISGTYQTACVIAKQVNEKIPGADIRVVDSRTAALPIAGMGKVLLEKIDGGCENMDELEAFAKSLAKRTHTFFTVDTLEYLKKGGRIGKASALIGSILGIRPILTLDKEGKVVPVDKCRSRRKALQRVMEEAKYVNPEAIYVCGALCQKDMEMVKAEMESRFPGVPCESSGIGSVLLSHLGPGVLGLFFREVEE